MPRTEPALGAYGEAEEPVWLTRIELSDRTRLSEKTLRNWACVGKGPKFTRFGGRVRYRLADVIRWENELSDPKQLVA
ncbi:helix-turn-helix transcriptional regulator [Nocardia goodfellowii]